MAFVSNSAFLPLVFGVSPESAMLFRELRLDVVAAAAAVALALDGLRLQVGELVLELLRQLVGLLGDGDVDLADLGLERVVGALLELLDLFGLIGDQLLDVVTERLDVLLNAGHEGKRVAPPWFSGVISGRSAERRRWRGPRGSQRWP